LLQSTTILVDQRSEQRIDAVDNLFKTILIKEQIYQKINSFADLFRDFKSSSLGKLIVITTIKNKLSILIFDFY